MSVAATSSTPPGDLREPGAILLVSCYELGHRPLGLTSPLAFLERAGFHPDAIDLAVERLDPVKVTRARFVGISAPMHTALRLGVRAAERVHEMNPAAHICFYGLYAALNAAYLLRTSCGSVIGGEFEEALLAWVERLSGMRSGAVEGVRLRDTDAAPVIRKIAFGPPQHRIPLPSPENYARLERDGRLVPAGAVETSRGCLHLCRHCPIPSVYGGRFFVVPRESVLDEIRGQIAAGAGHITFADPDFFNGPRHSLAIVREMHEEFPSATFDFTAKIEHLIAHRGLLPELGAAGCAFAVSAVESLSDVVLDHLQKGHTRRDVSDALAALRDARIPLRPSWLPFTPWSTIDDTIEMLEFIEAEGLIEQVDPIQYAIRLLIPPGSLLLEDRSLGPYLGPLVEELFSYPWRHPDPRMDRLHAALGAAVESGARAGEGTEAVFQRVRRLVFEAAGRPAPELLLTAPSGFAAPRLTEPWFC